MSVKHLIIQALCVTWFLASAQRSNEEIARDYIEHLLRISSSDRTLNTALGKLERSRQQDLTRQRSSAQADCEDPTEFLPEYTETLEGTRELRQIGVQKHHPICEYVRELKKLNTNEYEYRPAYYEEVRCTRPFSEDFENSDVCSSLGFSCVQWNKTIHLTRRRYASDCWESRTMVIPAGCECMWPVHKLGPMKLRA